MQCCKYAKSLECDECTAVYYKLCKKFLLAHAANLTKSIRPFKLDSSIKLKDSVIWSRDVNKAKSAACKFAIRENSAVVKLTVSQVLSIVIANQEIEGKVFYIDYNSKTSGDQEKVRGVITSFIEDMTLRGAYISIFAGSSVLAFTEYSKL